MIYLDANASEALRPEARTAMLDALDRVGNPASVHGAGRAARKMLEDAREAIASQFGGRAADLVFTSGGTEADVLAIHGLGAGRRVIAGATEHDAIRASAPDAAVLPVNAAGVADLAELDRLLAQGPPSLVCLMLAMSGARSSAPAPAGPPSLCDDSARACAPISARLTGNRPAA